MTRLSFTFFLFLGLTFIACKEPSATQNQKKQKDNPVEDMTVYQTENLVIKKLSNHIYVHISFLKTDDFGNVACNGMFVINQNKVIVFDTPTDNNSSLELIDYITKELKSEISAIVPTHFHNDCVGGIDVFEKFNIPMYAGYQTIELLKNNGQHFPDMIKEFNTELSLTIGNKKVYVKYFGEGHTIDNVIGYFPEGNALFGGCLIKEVGASKGYLGDANTDEWSGTVRKIKIAYPEAQIVIPGHGKWGGTELLDYTMELFEVN